MHGLREFDRRVNKINEANGFGYSTCSGTVFGKRLTDLM
jgi:biotin synthase-like enzyme